MQGTNVTVDDSCGVCNKWHDDARDLGWVNQPADDFPRGESNCIQHLNETSIGLRRSL